MSITRYHVHIRAMSPRGNLLHIPVHHSWDPALREFRAGGYPLRCRHHPR